MPRPVQRSSGKGRTVEVVFYSRPAFSTNRPRPRTPASVTTSRRRSWASSSRLAAIPASAQARRASRVQAR